MTMTTNKSKPAKMQIKNLEDLRLAKKKLKKEMKLAEKKQENSPINKLGNIITSFTTDDQFASSKIESSLQWIGDKASNKYPMKGLSKIIVSGIIMIAVPVITAKIQNYIKEKL